MTCGAVAQAAVAALGDRVCLVVGRGDVHDGFSLRVKVDT